MLFYICVSYENFAAFQEKAVEDVMRLLTEMARRLSDGK